MDYEGRVFRPPSEGRSLIIQGTIGCSHNGCRFCTMYQEKSFRIKTLEEIIKDLESVKKYHHMYRKVFIADGDAMSMKTKDLLAILEYIKKNMPHIARVGIYGHGKNILGKSLEELKILRENGLGIVYLGLESGSDEVLYLMEKGIVVDEMVEAGQRIREAGIKLSLMVISGLGGKRFMYEHAVKSAWAVNKIKPNYVSLLTLIVDKKAGIYSDIEKGEFELLSPREVLEEARLFIEEIKLEKVIFRSNHASNYLALEGVLGRDKKKLLAEIDEALEEEIAEGLRRL